MVKNINIIEGEEYLVDIKIHPLPGTALWASVNIRLEHGYYQLNSASGAVKVDGHQEFVRFELPYLAPGEYPYIITVGNPFEEVAKVTGVITVDAKPKKVTRKKRVTKRAKKEELPIDVEIDEGSGGLFTSETFPVEGEDDEPDNRMEMP